MYAIWYYLWCPACLSTPHGRDWVKNEFECISASFTVFNDSQSPLFFFPTSSSPLLSIKIKIRHAHHSSEPVNHNSMLKSQLPASLWLWRVGQAASVSTCSYSAATSTIFSFLRESRESSLYLKFLFIKIYVKNFLLKWGNIDCVLMPLCTLPMEFHFSKNIKKWAQTSEVLHFDCCFDLLSWYRQVIYDAAWLVHINSKNDQLFVGHILL